MKLKTTIPFNTNVTNTKELKSILAKAKKVQAQVQTKDFLISFGGSGTSYIDIEKGGCYLRETRTVHTIVEILKQEGLLSFDK